MVASIEITLSLSSLKPSDLGLGIYWIPGTVQCKEKKWKTLMFSKKELRRRCPGREGRSPKK